MYGCSRFECPFDLIFKQCYGSSLIFQRKYWIFIKFCIDLVGVGWVVVVVGYNKGFIQLATGGTLLGRRQQAAGSKHLLDSPSVKQGSHALIIASYTHPPISPTHPLNAYPPLQKQMKTKRQMFSNQNVPALGGHMLSMSSFLMRVG